MGEIRRLLIVAMLMAGCAETNAEFSVDAATNPLRRHAQASVFGVYRDGHMQSEYWPELVPEMQKVLGSNTCELGYDERFRQQDPAAYARIDEDSRQNGISRDLLNSIAPRAKGDVVLMVQVSGKPPPKKDKPKTNEEPAAPSPAAGGGMGGRGGMGGGGMGGGRSRGGARGMGGQGTEAQRFNEEPALEMSVSLFSPESHDYVARIGLRYTGPSMDEALKLFADKLHQVVPDVACVGWK